MLLFISSCTEPVIEEISMEELIPQSEYDKNRAERETAIVQEYEETVIELSVLDSTLKANFPQVKISVIQNKQVEFIDRMNFEDRQSSIFMLDSVPINMISWTYADSIQTENAFFNWIDCWGENCESFKVNENPKLQNDALGIWVGEKHIVYINSVEDFDFFTAMQITDELYGEDWKYVIKKNEGRRVNWFTSPID